jgi:MFS transporter, MFS domain-containing protein family, molybdate-anion transporter
MIAISKSTSRMIDSDQGVYYLTYASLCFALAVVYIRIRSTEGVMITTKEFKIFQTSFITSYSTIMICELIVIASFYHTFLYLDLSPEQITRLYVVQVLSSTVFTFVAEVVDIGSRKNKSVISATLFAVSTFSVLISGGHYELLLLGRVVFGAGEALYHSSFESYAIHEHTNRGFPDDWLTHLFTNLTHSLALVAGLSGVLGQSVATAGPLGCVALCCILYTCAAFYITGSWTKDTNSPKFSLSGFLTNASQTLNSVRSNRSMLLVMLIAIFSETSIMIFTFYWAPWITSFSLQSGHKIPYEAVYSAYVCVSMLGNYIYQLFGQSIGQDQLFQIVLIGSAAAYFLGAIAQTASMVFILSLAVQMGVGCYWPCIGLLRGRIVMPELRSAALTMTRILTAFSAATVLSSIHYSPLMMLSVCATLNGLAAFCHSSLTQVNEIKLCLIIPTPTLIVDLIYLV